LISPLAILRLTPNGAGVVVEDAKHAFDVSVKNGAIPATPPFTLQVCFGVKCVLFVTCHPGSAFMQGSLCLKLSRQ